MNPTTNPAITEIIPKIMFLLVLITSLLGFDDFSQIVFRGVFVASR
jgi:hypothetical protein